MSSEASAVVHEEDIRGVTGLKLHMRTWRPASSARASVMIVPGFNSHGGYYAGVAAALSMRGFCVFAVDLRGRGQSDGERFYVESFDDYVNDVGSLARVVTSKSAGVPVFLLGHSAGGVVACLYALEHQDQLAGLICESFAFQTPAPELALAALKGIAHIAPHLHVLPLKNEDFSRDPAAVERMNADPLIAHETQPAETIAALVRADEHLKQSFGRITVPVLILHGTADKAAKAEGSQFFYDHAGASDKTLKLYEGHVHDLLNDVGKERVIEDITSWIGERVGAR